MSPSRERSVEESTEKKAAPKKADENVARAKETTIESEQRELKKISLKTCPDALVTIYSKAESEFPDYAEVVLEDRKVNLGLTHDHGTGGHNHLHMAVAGGLLVLQKETTVKELLLEIKFLPDDNNERDVGKEIDREIALVVADGKVNTQRLLQNASFLTQGKLSLTTANIAQWATKLTEELIEPRDVPVVRSATWKGRKVDSLIKNVLLDAGKVQLPGVIDGTPAKWLGLLYPDDTNLCVLQKHKAYAETPAELAKTSKSHLLSHIVPKPILGAKSTWKATDGRRWFGGFGKGESLHNNQNFPEHPSVYLVVECDQFTLEEQWAIATYLGEKTGILPVMALKSGGKSLHFWYNVRGWPVKDIQRLFAVLVAYGIDPCGYDKSRKFRIPGGTNEKSGNRQSVIYFEQGNATKITAALREVVRAANIGPDANSLDNDFWRRDNLPRFYAKPQSMTRAAGELGRAMATTGRFYQMSGGRDGVQILEDRDGSLTVHTATTLAANIEETVYSFAETRNGEYTCGPSKDLMAKLMTSHQLLKHLPCLRRIFYRPIMIPQGGKWILLREGFHRGHGIYVLESDVRVDESMTRQEALDVLIRFTADFCYFNSHSIANHIGHAMTIFMRPGLSLRGPVTVPGFLYLANQPRLGKDTAAKFAFFPTTGSMAVSEPVTDKSTDRLASELNAFLSEEAEHFHSENNNELGKKTSQLEAFLTRTEANYRILGETRNERKDNNTTISLSANSGIDLSLDLERRLRVIRLHFEGNVEDRVGNWSIEDYEGSLRKNRSLVYSALAALVRSWSDAGCPEAKGSKFPTGFVYGREIASVVVHAGYDNPAARDEESTMGAYEDREGQEWQELLSMAATALPLMFPEDEERGYLPNQIGKFIQQYNLNEGRVNESEGEMQEIKFPDNYAGALLASLVEDSKNDRGFATALGVKIRAKTGTSFGGWTLEVKCPNKAARRIRYEIVFKGDQ